MGKGPTKRHATRLLIRSLARQGYSNAVIKGKAKCSLSTVKRHAKNVRKISSSDSKTEIQEHLVVLSQPRSGRPKTATSSPIKKKVLKYSEGKRKRSIRKTAAAMHAKGIKISPTSVKRILKSSGLKPYRRRKQPWLSDKHKKDRVKFANKYLNHDWENTLMTDESDFNLFAATNPQNDRVWAKSPSQVPPVSLVKHTAGIKVWGGVSAHGNTKLQFYKGTIGSKEYLKILNRMKPEVESIFADAGVDDWTYQHDGASAHKAKIVNKWLEDLCPHTSLLVQLENGLPTHPISTGSRIFGQLWALKWKKSLRNQLTS